MMTSDDLFTPMPTAASLRQDHYWDELQAKIDRMIMQSAATPTDVQAPAPARRQRRGKNKSQ